MHKSTVVLLQALLCGACLLGGAAHASGYLYVLNANTTGNNIYGYSVDDSNGTLTLLPGFPVATGGTGSTINASEQLVLDRHNSRLYAINAGSNSISAYSADSTTGALTALPFSPIMLGAGSWYSLAVHPSGSPLVIGEAVSGAFLSFVITPTSAAQAPGSPVASGTASFSTAFSRDGNFVYTGGNNNGNQFLAGFHVDAGTGTLTALPNSPYDFGDLYPVAYATDETGRLFTGYFNSSALRVFTTPAGIPTQVNQSQFISGLVKPTFGLLHPRGFYMVADRAGDHVGVYRIAGSGAETTLTPVSGSPYSSNGTFPVALALNHKGTLLFAANATTLNMASYSVAGATGVLTPSTTQSFNTVGTSGKLSGAAFLAPPADLAVTVTDSPHTVAADSTPENLKYTITLKNTGTFDASGVQVVNSQVLPTGVSFSSATPSIGTFDSSTRIWAVGDFPAGATATLIVADTVSGSSATGNNAISDTATVSANETLLNTSDDSATQSTNIMSAILSGPTATPNPGGLGQSIAFNVLASGSNLSYDWNFGDGSTGTGSNVTHAYVATGTYTVIVVVSSNGQPPQIASLQVGVLAPVIGSGNDVDGDGFSDNFESFAGSDPNSAASTPTGQAVTAAAIKPLIITKAMIKLNFVSAPKDSVAFSGTVDISANFVANGQKVLIDVGGIEKSLTLDAKGGQKTPTDSIKISIKSKKGVVAAQTAKYSVSFKKGSFGAALADENLSPDADVKKQPRMVLFTVVFNGSVLQKTQTLSYTAKKGKSGMAK